MNLPDWLKNLLLAILVIVVLAGLWSVVSFLIDIAFVLVGIVLLVGGGYLLLKKFDIL